MPPKELEVTLNGEKKVAFLIEKPKKRKRRAIIRGKPFEWEEEYIVFYIPVSLRNKKWLVIPL